MTKTKQHLKGVEKVGIIFSSNTMTLVKVGELSAVKQYLAVMIAQLTNPVEVKNAVDAQMQALGVTEKEAIAVVESMQREFYCIEVPNDEELILQLKQTTGMRQYLIDNNMLIVADDEADAMKKINKLQN